MFLEYWLEYKNILKICQNLLIISFAKIIMIDNVNRNGGGKKRPS
jgi:hypothetical protein